MKKVIISSFKNEFLTILFYRSTSKRSKLSLYNVDIKYHFGFICCCYSGIDFNMAFSIYSSQVKFNLF